jgi:type VI protein secretion system component VasK
MSWPVLGLSIDLPGDMVPTPWYKLGPSFRNYLAICGAIALVTLLAVLWAVYLRKRKRRHSRRPHSNDRREGAPPAQQDQQGEPAAGKRRRWRRRRRDHRPRNPTLAETGGLPPLREERPPEPFP